jgi:hypothetical protein
MDPPSPLTRHLHAFKPIQRAPAPFKAMRRCSLGSFRADAAGRLAVLGAIHRACAASGAPRRPPRARGQRRLAARDDQAPVRREERVRREPRAQARAVRVEYARALTGMRAASCSRPRTRP